MDRVTIFDTTLRDGEQAPGFSMNTQEKLEMARQLARLNVDVIEAGFPISSDEDFEAVREVARQVGALDGSPIICGLSRVGLMDIDRAWEAVKYARRPRIHTFVATSDIHLKYKLRKSRAEVLRASVDAVKHARGYCEDVEFSPEDASRSDFDYMCDVLEAVIDAGAGTINIPDTVGYAIPREWGERIARIRDRVKNSSRAVLSVHCHNDLGQAVANSLVAIQNGVRQIECTINGIGERAGNASLEEIVMALRTRKDYFGVETAVRTEEIYRTSKLLSHVTGVHVQPNKAIVGENAFAHEAGIHQDGMLKDRRTYEIMRPQDVGVPQTTIVLGKHSGRHAVQKRCEELGLTLSRLQLDRVYRRMIALADVQKSVSNTELSEIAAEVLDEHGEDGQADGWSASQGAA
jgi:2-isopropylmalate synthase